MAPWLTAELSDNTSRGDGNIPPEKYRRLYVHYAMSKSLSTEFMKNQCIWNNVTGHTKVKINRVSLTLRADERIKE
jgi:hypothetical protein